MERGFSVATRYGFKRSRWRGLGRVAIQDYLIAAVQNITILIRHGYKGKKAVGGRGKEGLLPSFCGLGKIGAQILGKVDAAINNTALRYPMPEFKM